MSRNTDVIPAPTRTQLPPLPIIDWNRIEHDPPVVQPSTYSGPQAPLPKADIVIITWTEAEWSAFDHVFINSGETRTKYSKEWRKEWLLYSRSAPESNFSSLWGYYRMVQIPQAIGKPLNVLLFKSDSHLAHPPWINGLSRMIQLIVEDTECICIYSTGTAGGSTNNESLGDAVITTSAHIMLKKSENTKVKYNDQTFTSKNYYPGLELLNAVQTHLLFEMSRVVTHAELTWLFYTLQKKFHSEELSLADVVTQPLAPTSLNQPKAIVSKKPLLTTDYYYIATGDNAADYCFLEMDDAVIGYEAGKLGVDFVFVRNISDPLVADKTKTGNTIPGEIRDEWSSLIYENFGLYTTVNSALTTWATIAGK